MVYAAPMRALTALGFIASGILHFTHTRVYERIMPPYVPMHRESVLVIQGDELVPGDAMLDDTSTVEIRPVISGGSS